MRITARIIPFLDPGVDLKWPRGKCVFEMREEDENMVRAVSPRGRPSLQTDYLGFGDLVSRLTEVRKAHRLPAIRLQSPLWAQAS
jgi:hypothetical protein